MDKTNLTFFLFLIVCLFRLDAYALRKSDTIRCGISYPLIPGVVEFDPVGPTIIRYESSAGSSEDGPKEIVVDENHVSTYPIKFSRCEVKSGASESDAWMSYKCGNWGTGLIDVEFSTGSGILKYFYAGDMRSGRFVLSNCQKIH